MSFEIKIGEVYRTPWEPSGLFRAAKIEPPAHGLGETVFGYYTKDHPKGYKKGYPCRYFTDDITRKNTPF